MQQVRGEHLVRQDGTISLGSYGCVYVAGLTLAQAKVAIERHLCQYLLDPEITVDVLAYNSKFYYVITDGAGFGQQVYRFPITGKETVLDAINNIGGLPPVASPQKIWVARPGAGGRGLLADPAGGLAGHHPGRGDGDELPAVPRRPGLCEQRSVPEGGQRDGQVLFAPIQRMLGVAVYGASLANSFRGNGGNKRRRGCGALAVTRYWRAGG